MEISAICLRLHELAMQPTDGGSERDSAHASFDKLRATLLLGFLYPRMTERYFISLPPLCMYVLAFGPRL